MVHFNLFTPTDGTRADETLRYKLVTNKLQIYCASSLLQDRQFRRLTGNSG
jgi:hypothetical protein